MQKNIDYQFNNKMFILFADNARYFKYSILLTKYKS